MEIGQKTAGRLRIGDLVLDAGRRQVQRGEAVLNLPKLSYQLLLALARAAPNVLTPDELAEQVWSGRIVSPETLTQRIKLVRQALGDDANTPRYIGLVRGEGYRLLVEVEPLQPEDAGFARNLLAELSRRRVLQVGLLYAAIAWSITEVLSFLLEALPVFPDWSKALVAIVFVVGFPVAMFLAWRFDIGPQGVRRTQAISTEGRITIAVACLMLVGATAGLFYLIYPRVQEQAQLTANVVRQAAAPNTIAVMPFENASGSPDDLYLSDGLADELRDQLGQVGGLRVAARRSSVMFRDQAVDAVSVAGRLSVAKLVEGKLRRQGNRLRITVSVIDGLTGFQDWTQSFDRPDTDMLAIQQEIANEVVKQMLPADPEALQASSPATLNPTAHQLMLLARYYYQQVRDDPIVNVELLLRAIDLYEKATIADPESALAQSRYAAALLYLGDVEKAEAPVARALEINPDLAEVQYTLGLYFWSRHEPGAGRAYERAVELGPNNADALEAYAMWIWHQPDTDRSEIYFRRALENDLMSISRYAAMGNFYGVAGKRDEAIAVAEQIESRFDDVQSFMTLARIYELIGDLDVAIAWNLHVLARNPNYVVARWQLAELYARIGDAEGAAHFDPELGFSPLYYLRRYDEFIDLTEDLVLERPNEVQSWFGLARAYVATGRYEQAINVLQRQGLPDVVFVDSRRSNAIEAMVTLADALNASGDTAQARDLATWLKAHFRAFIDTGGPHSWWPNLYLACAQSILGEDDDSLVSLERMVDTPGLPWYPVLKDEACFQKFADDRRYQAVIATIEDRMADLREGLPDTLTQFQLRH
jgi:TolB-like protein/DNA-binding winged helix-turn-helix (wHTH) protein/Flp pilus assembly protein TadD